MTSAERREQLIEVATQVFASEGADRASVESIASRAGVSKPVIYEHFGSKDGLFQRCLTEALAALSPAATPGDSTGAAEAGREELDLVLVALMELAPGHAVACHFPENVDGPAPSVAGTAATSPG